MGDFLKDNWPWIVVPIVILLLLLLWFLSTPAGSITEFEYPMR